MDAIKTYAVGDFTVKIYFDQDPINPCKEYDMLSHLACWHRRANLGHETIEGMSAKEIIKRVREDGDKVLAILPLYLYDHSRMTIRAGKSNPFTCRFDSGQVGWAYITRSSAEKMGCVGAGWNKARLEEAIVEDVKVYDKYLRGECYGFVVEEDGKEVDSCWGFWDLDDCCTQGKDSAAQSVVRRIEAHKRFSVDMWRQEVVSGTLIGYEEWVKEQDE